jgi:hypothetical protein
VAARTFVATLDRRGASRLAMTKRQGALRVGVMGGWNYKISAMAARGSQPGGDAATFAETKVNR